MSQITLDYSFMMTDWVGESGISPDELLKKQPTLQEIFAKVQKKTTAGKIGFLKLLDSPLSEIEDAARKLRGKFDNLVVCGVGGSQLGARAIENALSQKNKKKLYFAGDTMDPQTISSLTRIIDFKKTAFNIISKSGSTLETISCFLYFWNALKKEVGKERVAEHFVLTTDPQEGPLRQIAQKYNILSLSIPPDVSGRFSVLSAVGLLPASFLDITIEEILAGAKEEREEEKEEAQKSRPLMFAALEHLAYEKGHHTSVLFPYGENLREFGLWFRQLWAESLGKEKDVFGNSIHFGMTPILAMGPKDQHSQLQLYIEGPDDKIITFIRVEDLTNDSAIPKTDFEEFSYLSNQKFGEILLKEQEATALALLESGRPSKTIIIRKLNEKTLGALFYSFEMVALYLAELSQVNPFDQKAVEEGKNITYGLLGRQGFEEKRKEVEELKKAKKQYLI